MNNKDKTNLNRTTLQILYAEYKVYFLPVGIIMCAMLILLFIIIPQFQQYLELKTKLDIERKKLEVIKNNYKFVSDLDENKVDADLKTLSAGLPPHKDFAGVINAVSFVSAKTGVAVDDFSFQVGSVSDKKNKKSTVSADVPPVANKELGFPTFQFSLSVGGKIDLVMRFIEELYKTVPFSEITSIKTTGTVTQLTVSFYYRTYPPINITGEDPIVAISEEGIQLISNLNTWENINVTPDMINSANLQASSSAQGSYIPF